MDPIGTHTSKSEAQPNAKQKRYVVLGCLHTVFSIVRHAIQPRRKERSSAKCAAAGLSPGLERRARSLITSCQRYFNALEREIKRSAYRSAIYFSQPLSGWVFVLNKKPRTTHSLPPPPATSSQSINHNSTNQPIHQSTHQPINRSIDQPINQSTNQPINRSTNQSTNQPINQPINQSTNQPIINQSINQSMNNQSILHSLNQSITINQSINQSTNQPSIDQSTDQPIDDFPQEIHTFSPL